MRSIASSHWDPTSYLMGGTKEAKASGITARGASSNLHPLYRYNPQPLRSATQNGGARCEPANLAGLGQSASRSKSETADVGTVLI